jgi:hypothetical protein
MKDITKEEAIEICRESFIESTIESLKSDIESIRQWQPQGITDEPPGGCYMAKEHYETGCWFMTPPTFIDYRPLSIGAGPMVGVSKKTGKIVFSGIVGE